MLRSGDLYAADYDSRSMRDDKVLIVNWVVVAPRPPFSAGSGPEKRVANWKRRKADWTGGHCVFCRWIWRNRKRRLCDHLSLEEADYHLTSLAGGRGSDGT